MTASNKRKPQHGFNRSANQGDDEVIILSSPDGGGTQTRHYLQSFNQIAASPAPALVGTISEPSRFTKPLSPEGDAVNIDLAIKAPGTEFYIPAAYAQFVPEIEQMIAHYYQRHGDDGPCIMTIRQGITEPSAHDDTHAAFIHAHKDLSLSRISNGNPAPDSYMFVVSNILTTGFSDYSLSAEDTATLEKAQDPDAALSEILEKSDVPFRTFSAGSITGHSASAIHAIANPEIATFRTAIILAFHPEGEPLPQNTNNRWLEETVALRDQRLGTQGIITAAHKL